MEPPRISRSALVNGWAILIAVFALTAWFTGPITLVAGGFLFGGALVYTGYRHPGRWRWPLVAAGAVVAALLWMPGLELWFGGVALRAS